MAVQASPQANAFPEWLTKYAGDPNAVQTFCLNRGILTQVQTAVELVKKHFPNLEALEIRPERDPETDGESIVLDLAVRDDVHTFLEAFDRCKEAWVTAIPAPALSSICLIYSLH